jgi:hypothetical protein
MRRWVPAAFVLPALLSSGCGPKLVVEPIHQTDEVRVVLRRTLEGGKAVPHGYEHPVTIAGVRLAHILASLSHEDSKGKRHPTVRTSHVYAVAEGLGKAFERAGPDDEVAAAVFSADRRFGIFTDDRVTSLRASFQKSQLRLEFYAIEQQLEDPGVANEAATYRIPTGPASGRRSFRMVPGHAMALEGDRVVVVDWRDPQFRKPLDLRIGASGIRRRTILMEAPGEEVPPVSQPPQGLSDAQLRALDELDAGRRSGLIKEVEFQRRRRLVLEGKLEEAGYDSRPQ